MRFYKFFAVRDYSFESHITETRSDVYFLMDIHKLNFFKITFIKKYYNRALIDRSLSTLVFYIHQ
jgi:hypothetical protein